MIYMHNQSCSHALNVAEGEIKQSSYGFKCSALFTRQNTPSISPVWYPPGVPGQNDNTDKDPVELNEVEGGRGSEEEEEEEQSKQNVRAKEETLEGSKPWEAVGREVRVDPAKKRDDLHLSSLTISECAVCC